LQAMAAQASEERNNDMHFDDPSRRPPGDQFYLGGSATEQFRSLPPFLRGYISAVFFTAPLGECDGEPDLKEHGFTDLGLETLEKMKTDCARFCEENAADLAILIAPGSRPGDRYTMENAGIDFLFTRDGAGVGYWDRGFTGAAEEAAERLTNACEAWGPVNLDLDDDGLVYAM